MKKLLLLSLSTILCGGNMLATIQPVSLKDIIFHDKKPTYDSVPVDMNKIVKTNKIISPNRKHEFYQQLKQISLTEENILDLINSQYTVSGTMITSVNDAHISELLKEQRNILVKDIYDFIYQRNYFMGDSRAEDYIDYAFISAIVAPIIAYAITDPVLGFKISSNAYLKMGYLDIAFLATIPNLYRLYKHIKYIRNKENEINEIDNMITVIEKIEQAEISQ